MSFTSIDLVRKHLMGSRSEAKETSCLPITLTERDALTLPDMNIISSSEIVKWKYTIHPSIDGPLELIADKFVQLKDSHLVPGSIIVTLNDGLGTVYNEGKDYRIDYINGAIARRDDEAIPDHQEVYVYYEKYEVFERDTDYTIDYDNGTIARTGTSTIPDGATILIDYLVVRGGVEETLIDQAVVEANDIVLRSLAPEYSAVSTDQGLMTATTMLALSIVARSYAAETLLSNRASDAYSRSREWQNLSVLWENKAWKILGPFLDVHSLRSPVTQ